MKHFSAILLVLFLTVLLSAAAFAATGEELLGKAEMHLTFEGNPDDVTGKHTVESDGDTEYVEGRFGSAAAICAWNFASFRYSTTLLPFFFATAPAAFG